MKRILCLLLAMVMFVSMTVGVGAAVSNDSKDSAKSFSLGSSISFMSSDIEGLSGKNIAYYKFTVPYTGKVNISLKAYCTHSKNFDTRNDLTVTLSSSTSQISEFNFKYTLKNQTVDSTYTAGNFDIILDPGVYYLRFKLLTVYSRSTTYRFTINSSFACAHANTSTQTSAEPTCSSTGIEITKCSDCRKTIRTDTLLKLPHTPGGDWVHISDPTCAKAGQDVRYCTVCNKIGETKTIEKLPHTYGDWTTDTEPTCSKTGQRSRVCTTCNNKDTEAISKLDHNFGKWTVTTEASCTRSGKETRSCTNCGKSESQTIPALDHTYSTWKVLDEASCTSGGEETRTCINCGDSEWKDIPMLDHIYGDWQTTSEATCSKTGTEQSRCIRCGKATTRTIPMIEHTYFLWYITSDPTCTAKGKKYSNCSICNKSVTEEIPMVEHTYDEWVITKEATCTVKGQQTRTCATCKKTFSEVIPMVEHTYGEWTITKEATCTVKGKQTHTCTVCNKTVSEVIPMLEHVFGEWEIKTEATCTRTGTQSHTCTLCGKKQTETISKKEHTVEEWTITKEATETKKGTRKGKCSVCGKSFTESYAKPKYPGKSGFKPSRNYKNMFTDVGSEKWFYSYVKTAYEYGFANGMSETQFSPDNKFTVAQALTVAANIHSTYYGKIIHSMKEGEQWYTPYVNYCIENGIIADSPFADYTQNITRGEMAIIFAGILPDEEYDSVRDGAPSDMESGMNSYNAVQKLYQAGIISGDADTGNYRPKDEIVRSEACVIFTRIAITTYRAK